MTELTNAEKYTPQFGFVIGTVIEYEHHSERKLAYFAGVHHDQPRLFISDFPDPAHDGVYEVPLIDIKSIRLLSGNFRHWSEDVPDWAVVCVNNGPHIQFFNKSDWAYFGNAPLENEIVTIRPWWHQPKETKNAKED